MPNAPALNLRQSAVMAERRLIGLREVRACSEEQGFEDIQKNEHRQHSCKGREAMIAMQVAGIIAEYVVFLTLTDEDELNLDTAVKMTESLADHLEEMDKGFLRELVDAFLIISAGYSDEAREVVRDIPYAFYLEEAIAADDPVRLAELEALREAREELAVASPGHS